MCAYDLCVWCVSVWCMFVCVVCAHMMYVCDGVCKYVCGICYSVLCAVVCASGVFMCACEVVCG